MEIKNFENLICREIDEVVNTIISNNRSINISAKSRVGAEISDWLETEFVKKATKHKYLKKTKAAPSGKTKNPWDVQTFFQFNEHTEEIWIDFKALKKSSADSNPDIGTPTKIIKFISSGNFYLLYIYVYYIESPTGLDFVKVNNSFTKSYFLKDISSTVRRNPKNQLQINVSAKPEYRTRTDFIEMLINKIRESHFRQIEISKKALNNIDSIHSKMLKMNLQSEKTILDKIQ